MIRLRHVEDYRGRRIVTNGKMFGVQGELITDCRYLNVAGARAAIDSELGIARRKRDIEWQRAKFAEFVAQNAGREWSFGCDCGWRGDFDELKRTGMPDLFRCPACSSDQIMVAMDCITDEPTAAPKTETPTTKKRKRKSR